MIAPSCKTIQLTFSSIAAFNPCVFKMFENPVMNPRLICAMPTISVTTSKVSTACVLWIGYVIISPPRPCMISIVCHPGIKPGCPGSPASGNPRNSAYNIPKTSVDMLQ